MYVIKKEFEVETLAKEGDMLIYCREVGEPKFGKHANFSAVIVTKVEAFYDNDNLKVLYHVKDVFNITHGTKHYRAKIIYPWQVAEVIRREDINTLSEFLLANNWDDNVKEV